MKKNPKKLILCLVMLLLIISIILIIIIFNLQRKINDYDKNNKDGIDSSILNEYIDDENTISKTAYFDINTCVSQYLNIINTKRSIYYGYNEKGEYSIIVEENEIKKNIYDVLSKSYIKKNNITIENIYDYVKTTDVSTLYIPLEASAIQDENIQGFIIHGLIETTKLEVIDEIFAVVNIDKENNVFSIEPIYGDYTSINEIKVEQLDDVININDNNKFDNISVSAENIVKDYINIYKRLSIGSPEIAYNMLDEEYRTIRFQNLEGFKKYVEENKQNIISIRVEKYQKAAVGEYTQYLCVDQNNNYYIFKDIAPLQYTVMLDNYTIPTEEFTKEYNNSSSTEKVILNIKRFFMGIDDKNYGYSYSVLSESFKNNKYPTKNDFVEYVKQNFFEENKIEYISYEIENGIYIYKIKLTDETGNSTEEKEFNIILKLNSGTDFEMSFGENE